jgi:hypothetical protein
MFIATLFTRAKLWKHPRCLTIDEWIKKMWYSQTMYKHMNKREKKKQENVVYIHIGVLFSHKEE